MCLHRRQISLDGPFSANIVYCNIIGVDIAPFYFLIARKYKHISLNSIRIFSLVKLPLKKLQDKKKNIHFYISWDENFFWELHTTR